jgi:hypothetical protein
VTASKDKEGSSEDLLVSFAPGQKIFEQGQRGDEMFIVDDGQIELIRQMATAERKLSVMGPGDFFGEMSVLEDSPRLFTARALTACRVLPVDVSTFDRMLREHPEILLRMMRKLARRLYEYEAHDQRAKEIAARPLDVESPAPSRPPKAPATPSAPPEKAKAATPPAAPEKPKAATPPAPPEKPKAPAPSAPQASAAPAPVAQAAEKARFEHPASGASFALPTGGECMIGRGDPVTEMSPGIDLSAVDEKRSLSRRHARLRGDGGRFLIREEIGVANGTYVGGVRLEAGQEHELHDGDRVRLGLVELVFRS